jgi:Ca2+-binding RTX toxin-like protein
MQSGMQIESAQVSIELTHALRGDLIIRLRSPSGNVSILMDRTGKAPGSVSTDRGDLNAEVTGFSFNTTHVRGEDSGGTWTLEVVDAISGSVGTLKNWKLDLWGTVDNNTDYFYTNEFGNANAAPGAGRSSLADTNGGSDTINAAAVTTGSTINLNNGATSTIAGKTFTTNGTIERAVGGDGNDTLTGNVDGNVLKGGRGADVLSGGGGVDYLDGGKGNDSLTGGTGNDAFVIRLDANSTDTIVDFERLAQGEKILLVGFGNLRGFSQLTLTASGADTVVNVGNGQTVVIKNIASSLITEQNFTWIEDENALRTYRDRMAGGETTAFTTGNDWPLLLNPIAGVPNLKGFGLDGDDAILSRGFDDLLDGGNGNDYIVADYYDNSGNFPYYAGGNDWVEGGAGNDTLFGVNGNDYLSGGSGLNDMYGGVGDDYLNSASDGKDLMYGEDGNDTLVMDGDLGGSSSTNPDSAYGNRIGGAGADTFKFTANGGGTNYFAWNNASNYQLVEATNLIVDFNVNQAGEIIDLSALTWITKFSDLTITSRSDHGVNFAYVSANSGSNTLNINLRDVTPAQLLATHFKFAASTAIAGAVNGTTNPDTLTGDSGANTINGSAGADTMEGRTGDDTYIVDNTGDVVIELPGGGSDTVKASVTYTLSADVETLELTGTANINGSGNNQRNRLVGNSGNNLLDGGAEADAMLGGLGNDTYVVDNQLDTVTENQNEGTDTVQSAVSWTLGANVENLALTGSANINATGNDQNNALAGNAGNNILDGQQGADAMAGGAGDDTYYVDNVGDTVTENASEGIDTVISLYNYTLGANTENIILGALGNQITGNSLDNNMLGNSGNNILNAGGGNDTLDGGLGVDTLYGGTGDDVYFVDSTAGVLDTVVEYANEGTDTVVTASTYTLGTNVENLVLTGTAAVSGTGNSSNNQLTGNSAANTLNAGAGNDVLDGAAGADTMLGGQGDDTYYVDNAGDAVTENVNEGTDKVLASVSYALSANVENLQLTGYASINGTGNTLANTLSGNAGTNTLAGGAGTDVYSFGKGGGVDTVDQAGALSTDADVIAFDASVLQSAVTARRIGNDLKLFYSGQGVVAGSAGTGDVVIAKDWFLASSTSTRVDHVVFANGAQLSAAQLVALANQAPTGETSISGIARVGRVLTASNTLADADGMNTVSYQWFANGSAINGATANTLTLAAAQVGQTISVKASYTDGSGTAESVTSSSTAAVLPFHTVIQGTAGNDNIQGTADNEFILGGDGNDVIRGGGGLDILDGGAGRDYLQGESGIATYRFGRGYGQDQICNIDWNKYLQPVPDAPKGRIELVGLNPEDVVFVRWPHHDFLLIKVKGPNGTFTDELEVTLFFHKDASMSAAVAEIAFANGEVWSTERVKEHMLVQQDVNSAVGGYETNDVMYGSSQGATFMWARGGNDLLVAGVKSGTMFGENGNDVLYGGDVTDSMSGGLGNDITFGGDGDDWLYEYYVDGSNAMFGQAGNDLLKSDTSSDFIAGGIGNDDITLGSGFDVLAFNKGDGQDKVTTKWAHVVAGAFTASSTLSLGGGIHIADLSLQRVGNDLVVHTSPTINSSSDKMTLKNWYLNSYEQGIAKLQMVDAGIHHYNFKALVASFDASGTASGSTWSVTQTAVDAAHTSDSTTHAVGGELAYHYAQGTLDQLAIGTIQAQLAQKTTLLGGGTDMFGAISQTFTSHLGDQTVLGTAGDDLLLGGSKNDTLVGGQGNDTYLFTKGMGQDHVIDQDTSQTNAGGNGVYGAGLDKDTLRFGLGIKASDVVFQQIGFDLKIGVLENVQGALLPSSDSLTWENFFQSADPTIFGNDALHSQFRIEHIAFTDDTHWYLDNQAGMDAFLARVI